MRIVTGATEKSNIALLYEDLNWSPLDVRRKTHCLTLMYKILNGQTPDYLQTLIPNRQNDQGRPLRSATRNLIPIPFARTETYRRSFIPNAIRLWNNLDQRIRASPSLEVFKGHFKTKSNDMTKLLYIGTRWPSIHHARLRIGCSKLNAHLYTNLHVTPSPQCRCGHPFEDPRHFFFICPLFHAQRTTLMETITRISNNIAIETLLYGDPLIPFNGNVAIFNAVHKFIIDSHRFD